MSLRLPQLSSVLPASLVWPSGCFMLGILSALQTTAWGASWEYDPDGSVILFSLGMSYRRLPSGPNPLYFHYSNWEIKNTQYENFREWVYLTCLSHWHWLLLLSSVIIYIKATSSKCGRFEKKHLLPYHFLFPESGYGFFKSSRQGPVKSVIRVLLSLGSAWGWGVSSQAHEHCC